MIRIVPYDVSWPAQFETEAASIRAVFGSRALRVEHVGSTAIPGFDAKPVIDIQIAVATLARLSPYSAVLADLGYRHVPDEAFDAIYPFFQKPAAWPSTHHIHLCLDGCDMERRTLAFRDYLRGYPDVAAQYAELKRKLAAEHGGASAESREQYALAKTEFVVSVLNRGLVAAGQTG